MNEIEEVLHLKKILVTLKQYYEKNIQQLQIQLQMEVAQKKSTEEELYTKERKWKEERDFHQEELSALQEQQQFLKSLLRKEKTENLPVEASNQLLIELENIKKILQKQTNETEGIEARYLELLNEKIGLQYHCQQLELQIEQQSAVISECQQQLHVVEKEKKEIVSILQRKEEEMAKGDEDRKKWQSRIAQEIEKDNTIEQMKGWLEQAETELKTAQQHLAKKMKETALLNEAYLNQQIALEKNLQESKEKELEISHLQEKITLSQREEQALQEELNQLRKGSERQSMKWEEKYFHMYDKWQESENQVQELKKLEEKHLHMQNMLSHLGNVMGATLPVFVESELNPSASLAIIEKEKGNEKREMSHQNREERYDLFGAKKGFTK